MKHIVTFLLLSLVSVNLPAQFLKKMKEKAEEAVKKAADKPDKNKQEEASTSTTKTSGVAPDLKVYSKFDFVPGSTILYFDNFEKDNIGETPMGWITS
ncbi:MAG: hypothetical protein LH615_01565, partial [Ferruginibacter sp.]|nr:hypothetical protein [Ferruginibacter sp.]